VQLALKRKNGEIQSKLVNDRNLATRIATRVQREPSGEEIRIIGRWLIRYLCDDGDEIKPHWHAKTLKLAKKLIGTRATPEGLFIVPGYKKRLASAGLNENLDVIDETRWSRAQRQLKDRADWDPALDRIEEAMEAPIAQEPPAQQMQLSGKKITFGNAC
jgi:hypothetical protein